MKHFINRHRLLFLSFSCIAFIIVICFFSWKKCKALQKDVHWTTGQYVYKLDAQSFQQKKHEAFRDGNGKSALDITMHYWIARLNHDGQTGNRWCYIAAKLEDPHGLHNWWALGRKRRFVFALTEDEAKSLPENEYDYYIRFISALLRNDDAEAAVHLKRLRELGVTEKLLENPLELPGMEGNP